MNKPLASTLLAALPMSAGAAFGHDEATFAHADKRSAAKQQAAR